MPAKPTYDELLAENQLLRAALRNVKHSERRRSLSQQLLVLCFTLTSGFLVLCISLFVMSESYFLQGNDTTGMVLLALANSLVLVSIPGTYVAGFLLYGDRGFRLFQPGQGGAAFISLQAFSWTFYATSLFGSLLFFNTKMDRYDTVEHLPNVWVAPMHRLVAPVGSFARQLGLNGDHILDGGVLTVFGVLAILAQVLMVSSLTVYNNNKGAKPAETPRLQRQMSSSEAGTEQDLWLSPDSTMNSDSRFQAAGGMKLRRTLPLVLYMIVNSGLILVSLMLAFVAARMPSEQSQRLMYLLSLLCMVVGVFLTHGLGGVLSHNDDGWHFFQPFVGGSRFVVLQAITWTLFAVSVGTQLLMVYGTIHLSKSTLNWISSHSAMGPVVALVCQGTLVLSLILYRKSDIGEPHPSSDQQRLARLTGLDWALGTMVVAVFCNLHYVLGGMLIAGYYLPVPAVCSLSYMTKMVQDANAPIPGGDMLAGGLGDTLWAATQTLCTTGDGDFTLTPKPLDYTFHVLLEGICCLMAFSITYSTLQLFRFGGGLKYGILAFVFGSTTGLSWWRYRGLAIQYVQLANFVGFALYVCFTFLGSPEISGRRESRRFREWTWFWNLFRNYNGGEMRISATMKAYMKKTRVGGTGGNALSTAIVGFHPHGIFPASAMWVTNTDWSDAFPDFRVYPCTASIVHCVPLMRDIIQWAGVRDVSRMSLDRMLSKGESPLLVVGGQSEMFLSKSWTKDIAVHRGHRGFARMAIRHGVPVIPVFSFGEHKTMDNIYAPRLQAIVKRLLSFPLYFPYGRCYLPVIRREVVTVCVGAPVAPRRKTDAPTMEEIEEFHGRYFDALEALFNEFKGELGYKDCQIAWGYSAVRSVGKEKKK